MSILDSLDDNRLFQTLVESLHEGVYLVDRERKVHFWNRAAEEVTGFPKDEIIGHSCADGILMHVDEEGNSLCQGGCPLAATMEDGEERQARVFLNHKDGHRMPVRLRTAAIRDEQGTIIGDLETFSSDASSVASVQEVEELREQALACPVTGIGNRRRSEQVLEQKLDGLKQTGIHMGALLLDVDHLPQLNKNFGNKVGDLALKIVSRTLVGAMRSFDFVGRWDGARFLVLLPNLPPLEVESSATRFRALVEKSSRVISKNRLHITVSVGGCLVRQSDTPASLIDRLSRLATQSQNKGGNRVTIE